MTKSGWSTSASTQRTSLTSAAWTERSVLFYEYDHQDDELIGLKVDVSGEFIFTYFQTLFRSRSMKKITSRLFSQSPARHRRSRTQTGTFKCRTTQKCAPRPPHASRPPSCAALPPASTACHFCQWRFHVATSLRKASGAPTQIDENEHDDPHVLVESHVVISTDTDPIDSRERGV